MKFHFEVPLLRGIKQNLFFLIAALSFFTSSGNRKMEGGGTARRMRLRRIDSFRKLSALPAYLQHWIHTSKLLHMALEGFVEDLVRDHMAMLAPVLESMLQRPPPPAMTSDGSTASAASSLSLDVMLPQQLPHKLHETFLVYSAFFEMLLAKELRDSCHVTDEEFRAVMAIAALEERRDGLHFYRWLHLLDLACFVKMLIVAMRLAQQHTAGGPSPTIAAAYCTVASTLRGGANLAPGASLDRVEFPVVAVALQYIQKLSDVARAARRRRTCLKPLLFSWSPPDFQSVLKMIDASVMTSSGVTPSAASVSFLSAAWSVDGAGDPLGPGVASKLPGGPGPGRPSLQATISQ